MMSSLHSLDGVHDLSLPDWGPYSKKYFGISHLTDRDQGLRFDFTVIPAFYRRQLGIPDALRPSGYLPWSVAPDLSAYCYRQQLEARDRVYADIAFSSRGERARLVECRLVNHSELPVSFGVHLISSLETPPEKWVVPVLPAGAVWLDALDHAGLTFATGRPQDNLVYDALRRGERRESGTVRGGCVACRFGAEAGDTLRFRTPLTGPQELGIRCRVEAGSRVGFSVNGVRAVAEGTGKWMVVPLCGVTPEAGLLTLVSEGGAELAVDGVAAGPDAAQVRFEPLRESTVPEISDGPVPNSRILRYEGVALCYGIWWSFDSDFVRRYRASNRNRVFLYEDEVHQPFFGNRILHEEGDEWVDTVLQPVSAEPGGANTVYAVVCSGSAAEVEAELRRAAVDAPGFPEEAAAARNTYWRPPAGPGAGAYAFSQERMASVTLTNVVYPTYFKGRNVRHHTPGRRWNSLYTWDSGFIGLGLLEIGRRLAVENLNAYLTEPDDEECAFIHHGSPVPVQFYLFDEILNRSGDRETAAYFYPKLRHYYEFLIGRAPSSTMRGRSRRTLLRGWDYFYNSGGWDDYPPQWEVRNRHLTDCAPAVITSHVIRAARILSATAAELGRREEAEQYEADIRELADLLQRCSWDADAGYFSYVRYNEREEPVGILRHESGKNFDMGLDGAAPLLAGICTPDQKRELWEKLSSQDRCWTAHGLSTVDRSAPYFRLDGYWNGSIWMPYQWFFWKAALDDGQAGFAWRIAETALRVYETEVRDSYACYEQFSVVTGRGTGWHHFSALSAPVLCWFGAYFAPDRLTGGLGTRIRNQSMEPGRWSARISVESGSAPGEKSTLLATVGEGEWNAEFRGVSVPVFRRTPGVVEITLPRGTEGELLLTRG